jgi:hypothetical protein
LEIRSHNHAFIHDIANLLISTLFTDLYCVTHTAPVTFPHIHFSNRDAMSPCRWEKPDELMTAAEMNATGEWYWVPHPTEAYAPAKKVADHGKKMEVRA